jgi:hypothetical protein
LPQATITLNLLRKSRINPRMSAYAQLNGHFDFNSTPLAPPGTRIIAHEKPDQRASWDPHGLDGYYLGPALDHYRCYQVHITKTKGTRIVDTVEFFPATLAMPRTSSKDLASIAAMKLSHALQHPAPAAPFRQIGTAQLQALRQLSDIFSAALPSRTPPPASPSSLNSSQFGTTVRQGPADQTPIPPQQVQTPIGSPSLGPRRSQRINPIQVPSPRVTPRLHSSDVAPTRVHIPLPPTTVIPITPHPTSINAPYMPQGIVGVNLFNTFEEEHTPPTIPRYNTRTLARQHAAHRAQTLRPRIFRSLAFPPRQTIPKYMANSVINEETGANLEYRHLINDASTFTVWNEATANEFGRFAQGVGNRIDGSNTIFFIPRQAVPKGKNVTYGRFVVDIRPHKSEVYRVRLTVGGNLIQYQGDFSTRSANLTTSKCLWNSTISTDGAKYMCLDVNTFTWAHQWTLLNTCASQLNLSPTKSLFNTTYPPWFLTATSTLRFKKVCTACHMQEYLPTNYFSIASPSMAITKQHLRRASGGMSLAQFNSPSWWTILECNMWVQSTPTISLMHLKLTTLFQNIGPVAFTAASH